MTYLWHDLIGNTGVIFMLLAYLLLQLRRLSGDDIAFSILNGVGAMLVLVSLSEEFNMSAFIMEAFWLLISIYGLASVLKKDKPA